MKLKRNNNQQYKINGTTSNINKHTKTRRTHNTLAYSKKRQSTHKKKQTHTTHRRSNATTHIKENKQIQYKHKKTKKHKTTQSNNTTTTNKRIEEAISHTQTLNKKYNNQIITAQ